MTQVNSLAEVDNGKFYYDKASGLLTLKTDKFSEFEITFVAPEVCRIGTTPYTSLEDAVDAYKEGDTIVLTKDVGSDLMYPTVKKDVTVSSNGFGLIAKVAEGATLAIKDGKFTSVDFKGDGDVEITGGQFKQSPESYIKAPYEAFKSETEGEYKYYVDMTKNMNWLYDGEDKLVGCYKTVDEAVASVAEKENYTVLLKENVSGNVSVSGVSNLSIDLNGKTVNGTVTLFDCDAITVKNGAVNGQIRIGEHQRTIIKWKNLNYGDNLYEEVWGYHPLAPATNVVLTGLTVTPSSGQPGLYYTNIEDDLTRGAPTNYCDNNIYGKYIYKTGYTTKEQYINNLKSEVFTAINETDSVYVDSCTFNGKFLGNFVTKSDEVIKGILTVSGNTKFEDASAGRYLATGNYLVSTEANKIYVVQEAPETFTGRVENVYFTYAGGANAAITYARLSEEVYISENATAAKVLAEEDKFTVVSTNSTAKWTGAKVSDSVENASNYEVIETPDETNPNKRTYTLKIIVVVRVYDLKDTREKPTATTPYKEYGSLVEAFKAENACYRGYYQLMRDVTVSEEQNLPGYSKYGIYMTTQMVFDLNGYTYTYTGSGTAILCTSKNGSDAGSYAIIDTSAEKTGTVHATNGSAFLKKNKGSSDHFRIEGGNFISDTTYALALNGYEVKITGGTFESKKAAAVNCESNIGSLLVSGGKFISPSGKVDVTYGGWGTPTITLSGGTYSSDLSGLSTKIKIADGKAAVDNGDGTWTVKAVS